MSGNSGGHLHPAPSNDSLRPSLNGRQRMASPPYEEAPHPRLGTTSAMLRGPSADQHPDYALPPQYASRTNLVPQTSSQQSSDEASMPSSNHSSSDDPAAKLDQYGYPVEKKLRDHARDAEVEAAAARGRSHAPSTSVPTSQLPRIAVTDPLHDMRTRNLSKPEVGLGEKSDYPPKGTHTPRYGRPELSRKSSDASINTQSEYGYDDFDWSDDEGVEENLRTERLAENTARKQRNKRLSPWSIGRWMFTSFLGNLLISAILVVPAIVMQFVYRDEATEANKARRDYVTDNVQAWTIWASFNLFMSWVLHIFVEILPRLLLGVVALVWGRTNQATLNAAEYYNAQKGYIKPIFYAACSWASFAILMNSNFHLYNHSDPKNGRAPYLYRIYQVVEFFFFVTLTICAEKIIIKNIALRFHKSAFAERIAEVTKSLQVFDHLKDYRPKYKEQQFGRYFGTPRHGAARSTSGLPSAAISQANTPAQSPGEFGDDDVGAADDHFGSGTQSPKRGFFNKNKHSTKRAQNTDPTMTQSRDASPSHTQYPPKAGATGGAPKAGMAHPRKVLGKVNQARGNAVQSMKLTASAASALARVAMKDPLAALQSEKAGGIADINSPAEAKKLAKTIFNAFRGRHHRSYLVLSDFEPAFPTAAQAKEAFSVFDKDGNGDISQTEIKNTVLNIYKERRHLMKAIGDTNHAVAQLDLIVFILALVVIMFEAFAIFDVNVGKTLTTFYTLGIAFAFIFKESAQNVFDSIVFIFVTHPMDTGDRVQIGESVMVVKKMSLLSSLFTLADGTEVYIANSILANLLLINFRRSGFQWECFTIQVDFNTTLEQLDAVERDMCHWLQTEPERHFEPSTALVLQRIVYMRYIEITVGMTHRGTWQDWGMRFVRKNAFGAALTYYLKKHNVRYYQPEQPIFWQAAPPQYDQVARDAQNAAEDESQEAYELDDFDPAPDVAAAGRRGSELRPPGTVPPVTATGVRRPNYMGFTPSEELEGSGLARLRKTRMKGVTNQGGDG